MLQNIRKSLMLLLSIGLIFFGGIAFGDNHYVNGIEGIKAATVPPPGFYWRCYNIFYDADKLMDEHSEELQIDFDVNLYAQAHRFLWVSDFKILGADYGLDVIIPILYTDFKIGALGVHEEEFGFGDIVVEPLVLAWHGDFYDIALAAGFHAPVGKFHHDDPASPGKYFWTGLFTLGGTLYFDQEKTWALSALSRYEVHSKRYNVDFRSGDDFHFEWGLSKNIEKIIDVGLTAIASGN